MSEPTTPMLEPPTSPCGCALGGFFWFAVATYLGSAMFVAWLR